MNNVEVYTDGSCLGNPGPGGYAAIVIGDGSKKTVAGSDPNTTNNLMELTAVLQGLKTVEFPSNITVHTDSQLVIGWLKSGWKRNDTNCAILLSEIETLISEKGHAVSFVKVKGHSRHAFNEECDRVARMCATVIKERCNPIELAHNKD
ncbi:ribonuclease HI [bacterium]|nr:ribonuclease HI [bacterium]MCI0614215.1 ribonuclease HI [bacterium]